MSLPQGFICNRFLPVILLKQICLFKLFLFLLLYYPLFCKILIFYFKTLIQICFLISIAKLMLIIPLTFELFDKNVTISFFWLHFFHFICYIFILQLIFLENTYYYKYIRIFFHGHRGTIYFFHSEEKYKK